MGHRSSGRASEHARPASRSSVESSFRPRAARDAQPPAGLAPDVPAAEQSAPPGDPLEYTPANVPRTPARLGQLIDGRYRIERWIGGGGMGLVYECQHVRIGKRFAVKVLHDDCVAPEAGERLQIEARAASAIGNPHIVDISDFGKLPDGSPYLVMELLDGLTLGQLLQTYGRLPVPRVLSLTQQVAAALGAAHEVGILHRDLKPENVFVSHRDGEDFVKLLDFGLAKLDWNAPRKLTGTGVVIGTPDYLSPEQAMGLDVDPRSDIYSFGVLLYELLAGGAPFQGNSAWDVLHQHVYVVPAALATLVPPVLVPRRLERLVFKCLAKRPEHRFQTMGELQDELEQVADELAASAAAPAPAPASSVAPVLSPSPRRVLPEALSLPTLAEQDVLGAIEPPGAEQQELPAAVSARRSWRRVYLAAGACVLLAPLLAQIASDTEEAAVVAPPAAVVQAAFVPSVVAPEPAVAPAAAAPEPAPAPAAVAQPAGLPRSSKAKPGPARRAAPARSTARSLPVEAPPTAAPAAAPASAAPLSPPAPSAAELVDPWPLR